MESAARTDCHSVETRTNEEHGDNPGLSIGLADNIKKVDENDMRSVYFDVDDDDNDYDGDDEEEKEEDDDDDDEDELAVDHAEEEVSVESVEEEEEDVDVALAEEDEEADDELFEEDENEVEEEPTEEEDEAVFEEPSEEDEEYEMVLEYSPASSTIELDTVEEQTVEIEGAEDTRVNRKRKTPSVDDVRSSKRNRLTLVECPVCFDVPADFGKSNKVLVSLPCGHLLCSSCAMRTWLLNMHERRMTIRCPRCRKSQDIFQMHITYL